MKNYTAIGLLALFILMNFSCAQSQQTKYNSPKGYDLNKPVKYKMPDDLLEISGITFSKGNADRFYAIQDEDGKLFYGKLGDTRVSHTKFGKHGDYEDVAIMGDKVIVLKSNGKLYTFPMAEIDEQELTHVQELVDLLPGGEYESMYADESAKKLYVLCKNCDDERTTKSSTGYVFNVQPSGVIEPAGNFKIEVKQITKLIKDNKIKFRPSAMARNPIDKNWYIVSAVNGLLVVADASFKVTAAYPLEHKNFLQPEGLAFDSKGNMYISNEGDEFSRGSVLKFNYSGAK
ncbi:SdiA-regulated family protein [uncultured Mucilaginibacter sp.]|uniref:SdiA-regulated family protein n=1 Tax=uncultured Mucilaginibacter sp. TaxID=797541 RepID=UPI0025D9FDB8|nr:SdiA-regulated family protein [uncultured Mucilaginibacter sp.]